MTLPEGRSGKALAIAICGVLLAFLQLAVVAPLASLYADMQGERQTLEMQRAHLLGVESEVPRLRATVADMKRRSSETGLTLSEASDAVAAASLQAKLQALATADGGEITSVENLAAKPQDGFRRIGVRVVIAGDLGALTSILQALSAARPPLFVDNLEIHNNGMPSRQDQASAPILNSSFDVYGFRMDGAQVADSR